MCGVGIVRQNVTIVIVVKRILYKRSAYFACRKQKKESND